LLHGVKRWLCASITVLLLCGIVTTFSRGGFLGLIAAFAYGLLALSRHRIRNIAIACALAGSFYLAVPSDYLERLGTIQNTTEGTAELRLYTWVTATRVWLDYPVFGAGPDNPPFLLGKYQPGPTKAGMFSRPIFWDRDWTGRAIHSFYFQLLADRGAVGVALVIWMIIAFYRGLRRLRHLVPIVRGAPPELDRDAVLYALALEAGMAGFLIGGTFLSVLYYPHFWFFTALAVAHERAIRGDYAAHATRRTARAKDGRTVVAGGARWQRGAGPA